MNRLYQRGWGSWWLSAILFGTTLVGAWIYYQERQALSQLQVQQAASRTELARLEQQNSLFDGQIVELDGQIVELNDQLDRLQANNSQLTSGERQFNRTTSRMTRLNESLNVEVATLKTKIQALTDQRTLDEASRSEKARVLAKAESDRIDLQAQLAAAQARQTDLETQLAQSGVAVATVQEQLAEADQALAIEQEQMAAIRVDLADTRARLVESDGAWTTAQAQLAATRADLANTQEQLATAESALASEQRQLAESNAALATVQEQLAATQTNLARQNAQYQAAMAELTLLKDELNKAATTAELFQSARQQLALKQAENETYSETIERLKNEMSAEADAMNNLEAKLQSQLAMLNQEKEQLVTQLEDGTTAIKLPESILFASGSAKLNAEGRQALALLAEALQSFPNYLISIQGHTDGRTIAAGTLKQYPSNWELSSARAAIAVQELIRQKIPAGQLQAVGFADTRPLVSEANSATRQQNRRIEVILLPNQFKTKVLAPL
ncbi:OmpA family protein [Reinekea sp.]|jgi:chemotaxis protein MotB|uniref:OmpA family protein n=1 Tax=Reinekea sp. TaxID=1970455 RepID=UPI002A827618|nr:OmpA family protein [Reinekea sp.]